MLEENSVMQCQ